MTTDAVAGCRAATARIRRVFGKPEVVAFRAVPHGMALETMPLAGHDERALPTQQRVGVFKASIHERRDEVLPAFPVHGDGPTAAADPRLEVLATPIA